MALTLFDQSQINTLPSSKLTGTTTNDSAAAGVVGEYVQSIVGNTNAAATGQYSDLTSISLTAGDWDVSGVANWEGNGAAWTIAELGISTTSGNSGTGLTAGYSDINGSWASSTTVPAQFPITLPSVRVSLASTTTVYLKGRAVYSSGTPRCAGASIHARRVR